MGGFANFESRNKIDHLGLFMGVFDGFGLTSNEFSGLLLRH